MRFSVVIALLFSAVVIASEMDSSMGNMSMIEDTDNMDASDSMMLDGMEVEKGRGGRSKSRSGGGAGKNRATKVKDAAKSGAGALAEGAAQAVGNAAAGAVIDAATGAASGGDPPAAA